MVQIYGCTEIIKSDTKSITIQVTIPIEEDMLETEESIQQAVNAAGLVATSYALSKYDTDGSPIKVEKKKYTSKGLVSKTYQRNRHDKLLFTASTFPVYYCTGRRFFASQ